MIFLHFKHETEYVCRSLVFKAGLDKLTDWLTGELHLNLAPNLLQFNSWDHSPQFCYEILYKHQVWQKSIVLTWYTNTHCIVTCYTHILSWSRVWSFGLHENLVDKIKTLDFLPQKCIKNGWELAPCVVVTAGSVPEGFLWSGRFEGGWKDLAADCCWGNFHRKVILTNFIFSSLLKPQWPPVPMNSLFWTRNVRTLRLSIHSDELIW